MATRTEGRELIAGPDDAGRRLDKVLRVLLKDYALSEIYSALRKGKILLNDLKADPEIKVETGDKIFFAASLEPAEVDPHPSLEGNGLDQIADILVLATADLIFVNKPRGELSQGGIGIEPRIRSALASRSASSLSFVPGPLHRLDRNTTGIMTYPRSAAGARAFTSLLRERKISKRYLALVDGEVSEQGVWRDTISRNGVSLTSAISEKGEHAAASMLPLLTYGGRSLILVQLHTGLTHQIRVQASSRGWALSGDTKYGAEPFSGGYILHAYSLVFPEPPFADVPRSVCAPLPRDSAARLAMLFGESALNSALERARGE